MFIINPTLIVNSKIGQLGNTLLISAHILAYAIENSLSVINIPFDDYAEYFIPTQYNLLCSYPHSLTLPISSNLYKRLMLRGKISFLGSKAVDFSKNNKLFSSLYQNIVGSIDIGWSIEYFQLDLLASQGFLQSKKIIVLTGWRFRSHANVEKHSIKIREYFTPLKKYLLNVENIIMNARSKGDVLVGLHIRQGDYIKWLGGKFYFNTSSYLELMKKLESFFYPQKVSFLVCSNIDQLKSLFADNHNVNFGTGEIIEDMYSLASCDYIVGPPSTFSLWAAFYGNKPIYHVHDIDKRVDINDFLINSTLFWNL